jgi:hypothetical protein
VTYRRDLELTAGIVSRVTFVNELVGIAVGLAVAASSPQPSVARRIDLRWSDVGRHHAGQLTCGEQ